MRHIMLFSTLVMLTSLTLGCKILGSSSVQGLDSSGNYDEEPYIVNRLSIEQLQSDASTLTKMGYELPDIKVIQTKDGKPYGLRLIQFNEGNDMYGKDAHEVMDKLRKYLRAGDIGIGYLPIRKDATVDELLKEGMHHASIIINNCPDNPEGLCVFPFDTAGVEFLPREVVEKAICHIDSPASSSGCIFIENWHFFRPIGPNAEETAKKVAERAIQLYKRGKITFDDNFKTDVFIDGCREVACKINAQDRCPVAMYCSEMPFTLYSVLDNELKPMFDGVYLQDVLTTLKEKQKTGLFSSLNDPAQLLLAMKQYVGNEQNLLSEAIQRLNQIIDIFLNDEKQIEESEKDNKVGVDFVTNNLQNAKNEFSKSTAKITQEIVSKQVGPQIPPYLYMHNSKEKGDKRKVMYIGSIENQSI